MERRPQRAARTALRRLVDGRRLGAPRVARKWSILISPYPSCQRHQPDYPDANRGVAIRLRGLGLRLVTARTSNGDATDAWTRPVPPSPGLWEIRTLGLKWRLEVSWKRERADRNVETWAKNDLVISLWSKGLHRFVYVWHEMKFGFFFSPLVPVWDLIVFQVPRTGACKYLSDLLE